MLLGAYYYIWYGRPTLPIVGGGVWRGGRTNFPVLGEYNSRDERVITQQIDWAKSAGIDFFAVCWNDKDSWDDVALRDYFLKNPKSSEMKFCINYDSIQALNRYRFNVYHAYDLDDSYSPGKTKGEKLVEDFEYFADTYFNLPQYLKIDGRPVVLLYNSSAYRNVSGYFDKIYANMKKRGISPYLVGDVVCWGGAKISKRNIGFLWETSPKEAIKTIYRALKRLSPKSYESDIQLNKYFSAITGYNLYGVNRTKGFLGEVDGLYRKFSDYAKSQNLCFIPDIMPGYDDRNLMGLDRPILERENGKFYQDYWRVAKKYLDPKNPLALITTFNEWHEGSEIEPSKEYGDEYLKITKKEKE